MPKERIGFWVPSLTLSLNRMCTPECWAQVHRGECRGVVGEGVCVVGGVRACIWDECHGVVVAWLGVCVAVVSRRVEMVGASLMESLSWGYSVTWHKK